MNVLSNIQTTMLLIVHMNVIKYNLVQIDYSSLVDVRMVKHGNSELANVVAYSNGLIDRTKATRRSNDLAGDQAAVQSCKPYNEREGHTPAKGNVRYRIHVLCRYLGCMEWMATYK